MEDNIKRWTFKGKNALVLDIIRGSLTCRFCWVNTNRSKWQVYKYRCNCGW